MHREGHHLNLSVQGNFGSGISGGFFILREQLAALNMPIFGRCLEQLILAL